MQGVAPLQRAEDKSPLFGPRSGGRRPPPPPPFPVLTGQVSSLSSY